MDRMGRNAEQKCAAERVPIKRVGSKWDKISDWASVSFKSLKHKLFFAFLLLLLHELDVNSILSPRTISPRVVY